MKGIRCYQEKNIEANNLKKRIGMFYNFYLFIHKAFIEARLFYLRELS